MYKIIFFFFQQLEINDKHVHKLLDQLENQQTLHQEALGKVKLADLRCSDMEERLRITEGELATGDLLRSSFKSDKEKVCILLILVKSIKQIL